MAGPGLGAGGQVLVDVQGHHRHDAVGDRHVEVFPLTGPLPSQQCGHDRHRGLHPAGGDVGDGGAGKRRPSVGPATGAVETAQGEVVDVVGGPVGRYGPVWPYPDVLQ